MEHFRRGVEFGVASFQRCHSLSCQMAESTQIDAQKAGVRRKEKSRRPKCSHPADMPVIPEQAMEFLSRTWSPSSLDLFQILTPNSLGIPPEDCQEDETKGQEEEDQEKRVDTVRFEGGKSHLFNQIQTWRVLAGGKPSSAQRKHKLSQPTWLNVGQLKAILRGYFLDSVSVTGNQRRKRRDELRLHSAQAHAAVSVAQLAAAIAGIVSACELRPPAASARSIEGDGKMNAVLASATALLATVCAEAAEAAGANRPRVTSAVKAGLESRSSAELLTLTATAATCLRGATALKLRADVRGVSGRGADSMSISASIQKGVTLRVCLPCGKVRVRSVAVFPRRGTVALRLGKKHLRGAFATYDDYEVFAVSPGDSSGGGEVMENGRACFPVALGTSGGTVQLLFGDQTHCKVWKASIEGMLSDRRLKHAN